VNCPDCDVPMMRVFREGRFWFTCLVCHDFEEQARRFEEEALREAEAEKRAEPGSEP
jgi:hypothetical protein